MRKKWYKEPFVRRSKKIVPSDLILTWRIAALWACDDGTNNHKIRTFRLSTNCFSETDVCFLITRLDNDLGVKARMNMERNQPTITMCGANAEKFIDGIKRYIPWSCLQYKLKWRPSLNPNTSGIIGVSKVGRYWQAHIMINGIKKFQHFNTKEEAILIRKEWENDKLLVRERQSRTS